MDKRFSIICIINCDMCYSSWRADGKDDAAACYCSLDKDYDPSDQYVTYLLWGRSELYYTLKDVRDAQASFEKKYPRKEESGKVHTRSLPRGYEG